MATKPKYTPEQVAEALISTNGMVFLAADKLGCTAQTVYNYAKRHKIVSEAIEHQKGKRLDVAESALWRAILDGEAWAICFYLKTQGKARGYVERQELTGKDGGAIRTEIAKEIVDADPPGHHPPASDPGSVPPQ